MKTFSCSLTFGLLISFTAPIHAAAAASNTSPDGLDAKIAQLSKRGTTAESVRVSLGEPQQYVWGLRTFKKDALPDTYLMAYPSGIKVLVSRGLVQEFRCEAPGSGFTWQGKLRLGSSLEEVQKVVGPPTETLVGKPLGFTSGVLYKDIDGRAGYCYYAPADRSERFFFMDDKVVALYVTLESEVIPTKYSTAVSPDGSVTIVRQPPPADFARGRLESLPVYDAKEARNPWQVDLRGHDLSQLELSGRLADLLHSSFDSKTRWSAKLPDGFDPSRFMELGKDPGLSVRQLHAKGFTGKGVGLGIIDQTLLTEHTEYRDRLRLYEEIHNLEGQAQMHGPAVASIAVGKTVGVAPEADLYFIAETHGVVAGAGKFEWDFTYLAKAIDRLVDVSASLPKEKRIRVISVSVGWSPWQKGYGAVSESVKQARKAGIFVISTALEQTHELAFHGLGREPLADPNALPSFRPGSFWAADFWKGERFAPGQRLLVPMDARCLASPTGPEDYVFYCNGGWSWSVPWLAGLYAVACQANPDITPERFWAAALKTGETITLRRDGSDVPFGTIANPSALIEAIRK